MKRVSLLIAVCALVWQLGAAAHGAHSALQRQTSFGPVVGVDDAANTGTHAWKGVPFAAPPVGALRWAAPVDPAPWKSPRLAQQFGNACVQ